MVRRPDFSNRGVSPVIGVVLMVAVTVLLGSVVAVGVFAEVNAFQSPPSGDFAFEYSETYEQTETDSFGHTGQPDADGQTRILVEQAPSDLNAGEIALFVDGFEYNWAHHQTPYGPDDPVDSADSINVWAEHNDTVMVVWEGTQQSTVLDSFTVPHFDAGTSVTLPTPDEDCSWVESQLGADHEGDLTIDGIVVECDLDQYDVHKLEIINDGALIGEVEADGDIDIDDSATYSGDVVMLSGGNDVTLTSESEINGDVTADGGASISGESSISGDLTATGDVDADGSSEIGGGIDSGGNLDVGGSGPATVGDKVTASGNVNIHAGSTVQGDAESTNSGSVTLTDGTVLGAVATQGDVDVDSSTVDKHVYVDGSFSCDSSQINGEGCGTYTPKGYDEY